MKLTPITTPAAVQQPAGNPPSAVAARERAINLLVGSQTPAVPNQSKIAPEEMAAASPTLEQKVDESVNNETLQADTEPQIETLTPKEEPQVSSQLALLARREKALRAKVQQQEQTLKAREEAIKAKEADLQKQSDSYKSGYISKDSIKANTLKILEDAGVSYDDLTQQIISKGSVDPYTLSVINELKQQVQELKAANETAQKTSSEQQTQAYQAAVNQISADAKRLVSTDPRYEMIKASNKVSAVVKLIEDKYAEDKTVMDLEEAADLIENELVSRYEKIAKLNKIQKKLQEASIQGLKASPQKASVGNPKQTQPMKTLTNAGASTRQLSARERAILAAEGKL